VFHEELVAIDLRLECLWLEVMGVEVRERRYDCFGLGIDRGRRAERIELVLRSESRDSKSELGVGTTLV
jgi:hypothetical protein